MKITTIALVLFAISGMLPAETIPVTGFGSFSMDNYFDTYANFCMFGDGVATCASNVPIGPSPPVFLSQLTPMDVSGTITVTSYQEFQTRYVDGRLNTNWWAQGTFTITQATPEPSTWWIVGLSLVIFAFIRAVTRP